MTDGLSNTLLVGERAGRPDWYRRGKPVFVYPNMSDPPFGNYLAFILAAPTLLSETDPSDSLPKVQIKKL